MRVVKRRIQHLHGGVFSPHENNPAHRLIRFWSSSAAENTLPVYGPQLTNKTLSHGDIAAALYNAAQAVRELCLYELKHVHLTQLGVEQGAESKSQQLSKHFYLKGSRIVCEYLQKYDFLFDVLFLLRQKVDQYFDSATLTNLELFTDPEDNNSSPKLFALILTTLSSDAASARLEQLDEEWWLDQPREVRRVLNIDVDYIDGV